MIENKLFETKILTHILPALTSYGRKISELHHSKAYKVLQKPDDSPVTSADKYGNEFWMDLIQDQFPDHEFVGEENESHSYPAESRYVWFVDPIDGTRQFISGKAPYFVLLGLAIEGTPEFGIYFEPESGRLILGGGLMQPRLTYLYNNHPDFTELTVDASELPSHLVMKGFKKEIREIISEKTGFGRTRYLTHIHNMLAPLTGDSSGFVTRKKLNYWDLCAPAAIMKSLGFKISMQNDGSESGMGHGYWQCDQFQCLAATVPEKIGDILRVG